MVIKLIQIDSEDPVKINLSSGEHLFGRGKLLGCDDKRISRNHGELHVFEDSIEIKALHQNPCFYTKKGTEDKEILRKDSSISLSSGDRFGLLPDAFWYEVLHCTQNGSQETVTENIEETLNPDETINKSTESQSIISETSEAVLNTHNSPIQNSNSNENGTTTEKVTVKRSHSIEQTDSVESKKVKTEPVEVKIETTEMDIGPTEVQTAPTRVQVGPIKVKNEPAEVKTEPTSDTENINTEPVDVKQECNDTEGPSVNQAANSDGAANANKPPRERCMYGANCYRRNPTHFAQFSHPSDTDWGAGEKVPCPFGVSCCRRDPRHFRDHSHPPGHRAPMPQGELRKRRRVRNKKLHNPGSSSDSEDYESEIFDDSESETSDEHYDSDAEAIRRAGRDSSYSPPPGMLVRFRKKHLRRLANAYSDFFSDESDPFATDESDEWEPEPGES